MKNAPVILLDDVHPGVLQRVQSVAHGAAHAVFKRNDGAVYFAVVKSRDDRGYRRIAYEFAAFVFQRAGIGVTAFVAEIARPH